MRNEQRTVPRKATRQSKAQLPQASETGLGCLARRAEPAAAGAYADRARNQQTEGRRTRGYNLGLATIGGPLGSGLARLARQPNQRSLNPWAEIVPADLLSPPFAPSCSSVALCIPQSPRTHAT